MEYQPPQRPSRWFALIPSQEAVVVALLLGGAMWAVRTLAPGLDARLLITAIAGVLLLDFCRSLLICAFYEYRLLPEHVSATTGIIRRSRGDIALARVQHIGVRQSVAQRLTGCGSVHVAAADGLPVVWSWVGRPYRAAEHVRGLVQRASGSRSGAGAGAEGDTVGMSTTPQVSRASFKVLGLVGGIGAGKSAVANVLADLGYVVLDADKDAKAALERPDVRGFLISWWGSQIVGADGTIDRKQVASIVFAKPEERRKLEALVHPIVRADRTALIEQARRAGRPGVVIDAPLLFEAGSAGDCSAVLFVDSPRALRLERVRTRGWTDEELARREAAQLPLEEKRARSHAVIVNDGTLAVLRQRVLDALADLQRRSAPM